MNEAENTDDSDYEEEESLVLVELSGIMEADLLPKVQECKVLGIDTEKPLLQLDNYVFQGDYEDAMGTCLLFEEKITQDTDTDDDRPQKELELKYLTNKKLCMQRVFIKKNIQDESGEGVSEQMEVDGSKSSEEISQQGSSSHSTDIQPESSLVTESCAGSSEKPGTVSQDITLTCSGSDSRTDMLENGTIFQTGLNNSTSQTASQPQNVMADSSRTSQGSSSLAVLETTHGDTGYHGDSGQSFTIEVYTGMDPDDNGQVTGSPLLSTSEQKGQVNTDHTEKPNG